MCNLPSKDQSCGPCNRLLRIGGFQRLFGDLCLAFSLLPLRAQCFHDVCSGGVCRPHHAKQCPLLVMTILADLFYSDRPLYSLGSHDDSQYCCFNSAIIPETGHFDNDSPPTCQDDQGPELFDSITLRLGIDGKSKAWRIAANAAYLLAFASSQSCNSPSQTVSTDWVRALQQGFHLR